MKKTFTALEEPIIWSSGSQLGMILPPKGHLAMFGDIFGCHDLGGQVGIPGIWRVEAWDATGQQCTREPLSPNTQ